MDANYSYQHMGLARSATAMVLVSLFVCTGCGGKKGVERYDLSGQVKYDGKIVPKGYLRFVPDKKQGNRGPGSSATIIDGQYKTMPGQGTVGGPHVVTIVGTDGVAYKTKTGLYIPIGRSLFPEIEKSIDIPKESGAVHDFDLTAVRKKKRRSR
jgi:hypothetical protein